MKIYLCGLLALYAVAALESQVVNAANREEFLLKVTVIDRATADVRTRIAPRKPFEWFETHNNTKITIKGELSAKQKGSYHLRLTLVKDEKTNSTEEYEVDLTPGKPESRGFVSSFLYRRIILLANVPEP
jgi:hypothetical protein